MKSTSHSSLFGWMVRHWIPTFVAMTACFVGSGLASFNLIKLISANASFFARHGVAAVMYGGLTQLAELVLLVVLAVAFYFFFKVSEHALIERLAYRQKS